MKPCKYLLFLLFAILCSTLFGQDQQSKKASKLYKEKRYADAIPLLEEMLQEKDGISTANKLAFCYRMTNKMEDAEKLYSQIVENPRAKPKTYYYYGEALMSNGKYDEAKIWFSKYLEKDSGDEKATQMLAACDHVKLIKPRFENIQIRPFAHNSPGDDTAPVLYQDAIVFSSDRALGVKLLKEKSGWTGRDFINLYVSYTYSGGDYKEPIPFSKKLNALNKNTANISFTKDGNEAYFTRNGDNLNRKSEYSMQLYSTESTNNKTWKKVALLPFCNNSFNYMHPSVSPDGKFLFFVSDKAGGIGGTDIYMSKRKGDKWSKPINLGININSGFHEGFPYYHSDGKLYFCSKGHEGFGGFDIYYSELGEDGKWKKAVNVGRPINSSYDDVSIFLSEKNNLGMFTSSRDGGDDDIYIFNLNGGINNTTTPPVTETEAVLPNETLEEVPESVIAIIPNSNNAEPIEKAVEEVSEIIPTSPEKIESSDSIIEIVSKPDTTTAPSSKIIPTEEMIVKEEEELKIYPHIKTSEDNLKPTTVVSIKPAPVLGSAHLEDLEIQLMNNSLTPNQTFTLKNVRYPFKADEVTPDIAKELDKIALLMKKYPNLIIEIGGHTESVGKDDRNLEISIRRAEKAVNYLIQEGIEKERIKAKGYGETALLNECTDEVLCTFNDHMVNQRLEVKILGN